MAVKIRLARMGKKKKPFYRLVVMDASKSRNSETIEIVGVYDPTRDPLRFEVSPDRVRYWLSVGAQPTKGVLRLLSKEGFVEPIVLESSNQGVSKKSLKTA